MNNSFGQSERGVEAARCESPAALAASVLLTTCKSAAVQWSKPAWKGACECATRNGIARKDSNQSFFISNHLSATLNRPARAGMLIRLDTPSNEKSGRLEMTRGLGADSRMRSRMKTPPSWGPRFLECEL